MNKIRPLDYVLAALMTAGGVLLMVENMTAGDDPSLIHQPSTTSWLIIPAFLLVTVPILGRRGNVALVAGVTAAAAAVHVVAFDWLTRCGVVLPLAFALGYAVARFARTRRDHVLGLAAIVALLVVTLFRDSSADLAGALPIARCRPLLRRGSAGPESGQQAAGRRTGRRARDGLKERDHG